MGEELRIMSSALARATRMSARPCSPKGRASPPTGARPAKNSAGARGKRASASASASSASTGLGFVGVHHVGLICENLEKSMEFYQDVLGLPINPERPDDRLPYRGAWLWIGPEMIHLMELPNPDPTDLNDRPDHGGRDRHFCMGESREGRTWRTSRRSISSRAKRTAHHLSLSLSLSLEAFAPFVEEEGPADPSPVFLEPISPKPKASKTFQRSRRP